MRPPEAVVAAKEFEVLGQALARTDVARRAPVQVCGAVPDREVQALDERGVQLGGILGPLQGFAELPLRTEVQLRSPPLTTRFLRIFLIPWPRTHAASKTRWIAGA